LFEAAPKVRKNRFKYSATDIKQLGNPTDLRGLFSLRSWDGDGDVSEGHLTLFAALQHERRRQSFVAVDGSAGDARNFLVVDDGLAVLYHRYATPYQRGVIGLPNTGGSRQLRVRREVTVNATGMVAGRLIF
jgi:hypothetical protein